MTAEMTSTGEGALSAASRVFERVLCGVDDSPASLEAVRQASRLLLPGGTMHVVSTVYLPGARAAGWSETRIAEELEQEAGETLRRAAAAARNASSRIVEGPVVRSLLAEIEREHASLAVLGSHGHSWIVGILAGHVTTALLHEAPCPVLIARTPADPDAFPAAIVVGIDGSAESAKAAAVATELRDRFDARLLPVAAYGGKTIDFEAVARMLPDVEVDPREPVEALLSAARKADLLVVGSRGVHGLRELGSVSQQVAHRAACSVLVVR